MPKGSQKVPWGGQVAPTGGQGAAKERPWAARGALGWQRVAKGRVWAATGHPRAAKGPQGDESVKHSSFLKGDQAKV